VVVSVRLLACLKLRFSYHPSTIRRALEGRAKVSVATPDPDDVPAPPEHVRNEPVDVRPGENHAAVPVKRTRRARQDRTPRAVRHEVRLVEEVPLLPAEEEAGEQIASSAHPDPRLDPVRPAKRLEVGPDPVELVAQLGGEPFVDRVVGAGPELVGLDVEVLLVSVHREEPGVADAHVEPVGAERECLEPRLCRPPVVGLVRDRDRVPSASEVDVGVVGESQDGVRAPPSVVPLAQSLDSRRRGVGQLRARNLPHHLLEVLPCLAVAIRARGHEPLAVVDVALEGRVERDRLLELPVRLLEASELVVGDPEKQPRSRVSRVDLADHGEMVDGVLPLMEAVVREPLHVVDVRGGRIDGTHTLDHLDRLGRTLRQEERPRVDPEDLGVFRRPLRSHRELRDGGLTVHHAQGVRAPLVVDVRLGVPLGREGRGGEEQQGEQGDE
jgi:hypothetical protein